jgi:hypothetical protein
MHIENGSTRWCAPAAIMRRRSTTCMPRSASSRWNAIFWPYVGDPWPSGTRNHRSVSSDELGERKAMITRDHPGMSLSRQCRLPTCQKRSSRSKNTQQNKSKAKFRRWRHPIWRYRQRRAPHQRISTIRPVGPDSWRWRWVRTR